MKETLNGVRKKCNEEMSLFNSFSMFATRFLLLSPQSGHFKNLLRGRKLLPRIVVNTVVSSQKMSSSISNSNGSNSPKIVTHDGIFHADDALACFLLKILPDYRSASIVRTRDQKEIDSADIVVDVGAVYDPDSKRFDHHQRSFTETMSGLRPELGVKPIKLSSAGLVYHHFGDRILSQLLQDTTGDEKTRKVEVVFKKVYEGFISEIDAIDNGVKIAETDLNYEIHTHISARVGNLRPAWNQETNDEILMERFVKAMELIGGEFVDKVKYYGEIWYPARSLVEAAFKERKNILEPGAIIDLSNNKYQGQFPWKEHLFDLEAEEKISGEIKFAIFQDTKGKWRVQGVPVDPHSFDLRIPLHHEWQGLRDDVLSKKSGIPGCIFVHASGFIGGNETREGALEMATKTLELHECL